MIIVFAKLLYHMMQLFKSEKGCLVFMSPLQERIYVIPESIFMIIESG